MDNRTKNSKGTLTPQALYKFTPYEVYNFLEENYSFSIPSSLETPDQMRKASQLTAQLTNSYSYLLSLNSALRVMIQASKKEGKNKNELDELNVKKAIVSNKCDAVKQAYQALSRLLTIKQLILQELSMNGDGKSFE